MTSIVLSSFYVLAPLCPCHCARRVRLAPALGAVLAPWPRRRPCERAAIDAALPLADGKGELAAALGYRCALHPT